MHLPGHKYGGMLNVMLTQNEIYAIAESLIKQHGKRAEALAESRMQELMQQDDAKGAGEWLSIMAAIEDLHSLRSQKKLH